MDLALIQVAAGALDIVNKAASLINLFRERRITSRAKLREMMVETDSLLAVARSHAIANVVVANVEELARTAKVIEMYANNGDLYGRSLDLAYDQLDTLNYSLRVNAQRFQDEVMRI